MNKPIKKEDMVFHFLNVGFGDNTIIELPPDFRGERMLGVVDCCDGPKTFNYIESLRNIRKQDGIDVGKVAFLCATHPHKDHIQGIKFLMEKPSTKPLEFLDSGFRHQSITYQKILRTVIDKKINMRRVSSGMEWYFGKLRITALAPAVHLRNRYATYGIDMNNASIVLRFEHCKENVVTTESLRYEGVRDPIAEEKAGENVVILSGDAEFDSWAYITQEYPSVERTGKHNPLVKKMMNHLNCWAIKVAHHGSMHSTPLDVYERMSPSLAIVSTKQKHSGKNVPWGRLNRDLFPHPIAKWALEESKTIILTTDGSYETAKGGTPHAHEGTIVVVVPPGKTPLFCKLNDSSSANGIPPNSI